MKVNGYRTYKESLMYAFMSLPVEVAVKVCRDARVPIEPGERGNKWRQASYRYMKTVRRLADLWDSVVKFQDEGGLPEFQRLPSMNPYAETIVEEPNEAATATEPPTHMPAENADTLSPGPIDTDRTPPEVMKTPKPSQKGQVEGEEE